VNPAPRSWYAHPVRRILGNGVLVLAGIWAVAGVCGIAPGLCGALSDLGLLWVVLLAMGLAVRGDFS